MTQKKAIKVAANGAMIVAGGVALAVGVGYLLGTLFAPKSGKDTRAAIRTQAAAVRDKAKQRVAKAKDKADDISSK